MLLELHCHTSERSPCSHISAAELAVAIHTRGLGGIVFTDHSYLWPDDEINELRARLVLPGDFVILSGQEVYTRDFGDVLVYGAERSITERVTLADLRKEWPHAALVWAHPYRSGLTPSLAELFDANLDAIEIINPNQKEHENSRGIADWKNYGFVATSGSDIHERDFGMCHATRFEVEIATMQGLVSCLKGGMCMPTTGLGNDYAD